MRHAVCTWLFTIFGHRACCPRIPDWTAKVGPAWEPRGDSRRSYLNLYNVLWGLGSWVREGIEKID